MIRLIRDAEGWVQATILQEPSPPSIPEGEVVVEALPSLPLPLLHVTATGGFSTPSDDRVAWRRLRSVGYDGSSAVRAARDRSLEGLPEAPPLPEVTTPAAIVGSYAEIPRLSLRRLRHRDLGILAEAAVSQGDLPARCPQDPPCCRPPEAHAWMTLAGEVERPNVVELVLTYHDLVLGAHLLELEPLQALLIRAIRIAALPDWFWRHSARPWFDHLQARGLAALVARTARTNTTLRARLIAAWGGTEEGLPTDPVVRVRIPVDQALATMAEGWPGPLIIANALLGAGLD